MHYWGSYCARQALGVPQSQAKGPPGSEGQKDFPSSVLEGLLYFISPLLYTKTGLYLLFHENNCLLDMFSYY